MRHAAGHFSHRVDPRAMGKAHALRVQACLTLGLQKPDPNQPEICPVQLRTRSQNGTVASVMFDSQVCTHPNVGAVLLVSRGCESFNRAQLAQVVADSGRPVETLVIQKTGGTAKSIAKGTAWVADQTKVLAKQPRV